MSGIEVRLVGDQLDAFIGSLARQVHEALAADLADHGSLAATLKVSGPPGSERFTTATAGLFVERMLGRLGPPTTA